MCIDTREVLMVWTRKSEASKIVFNSKRLIMILFFMIRLELFFGGRWGGGGAYSREATF